MTEKRAIDKLANYIMFAAAAAIVCALCWYFRSVLIYIIIAAVVALIGRPIMNLLKKVRIKGKCGPNWLLSIVTLFIIAVVFLGLVTQVIPVVSRIVSSVLDNLSTPDGLIVAGDLMRPLDGLNEWLVNTIPNISPDFRIEQSAIEYLKKSLSISSISSVIGSVASALISFGIGAFSVVFISFFFIRNDKLFRNIIAALVPDHLESKAISAIGDIEYLLSRYFVGLIIEVLAVSLLNFLGLWLIARLGFSTSMGIGFMIGMLNVIPYVGPWFGGAVGVILGLVLKYSAAYAGGIAFNPLVFALIMVAIFVFAQMIDNFLLQPLIYSTSIKASPLEIFIVLLLAGHIGGIAGMLVAIPAYTAVRVIASRFFYDVKAIRRLIPDKSQEEAVINSD